MLRELLAHPLTRGLDEDNPLTTELRRRIILDKPFLRSIYTEWYKTLLNALPPVEGRVLELGSGAGFFQQMLPDAITSEVFVCKGVDAVLDARRLPFPDASLRAIVMTDVMHHIPDVELFLAEARRTLKRGARLLMIEPWVSAWSTFVYTRFHHEPFLPDAADWSFASSGPLSGANGALPWIVFRRDVERFRRLCPEFEIAVVEPCMPFRYLLSGGVSMRSLAPGWSFALAKACEAMLRPWRDRLAMFAFIQLNRR